MIYFNNNNFKSLNRNAEKLSKLNAQIAEQTERQTKAEIESKRVQEVIDEVALMLWKFCDRLRVSIYFSDIPTLIKKNDLE